MSTKLAKSISSMSVAVLCSRLLGLIRDQVFAYYFGASWQADAFNLAFTIPNLLRRMFGEGALGAAFIPIYQTTGVQNGRKAQVQLGTELLSLLVFILSILSVLGVLLAPLLVKVASFGFDAPTHDLAVSLTRILFPYLFFIGIFSILIAILNSHRKFFLPGLSSAFLNIGMLVFIGVTAYQAKDQTTMIHALAWGVLAGGFLQTVVNWPQMHRLGYRLRFTWLKNKKTFKLLWTKFLPGVASIAVRQINLLADKQLASLLVTGSISALNYGNRLMQLPLGIFGAAVGTAVIPDFSSLVAHKKWEELAKHIKFAQTLLIYIMLPVTAIIIGMGRNIIALVFMRGAFDLHALDMTNLALVFYSLGLIFYTLNRVFTAIFFALGNTKTPAKIAGLTVLINVVLNIILMQYLAHGGLALATSISALVQFIILRRLVLHFTDIQLISIKLPLFKSFIFSALLGFATYYWQDLLWSADFWSLAIKTASVAFIYLVLYAIFLYFCERSLAMLIWKKVWRHTKN